MRKLFLFAITAIISLNMFCQVHWIKYENNPVMVPGAMGEWDEEFIAPGSVLFFNNTYHMWYQGGKYDGIQRIGYATSPDGITWTKDVNNPLLDVGPAEAWDENTLFGVSVIKTDSIFHMWYSGHTGSVLNENYRIGHATSPDGIIWTKDMTNNPVVDKGAPGEWDDMWVMIGSVIYDSVQLHMYYSAWDGTGDKIQTGHATSSDGVLWTKDPQNPVIHSEINNWDYPNSAPSAVVFDGEEYHMWFAGGQHWSWEMGYAKSVDGSTWVKDTEHNPILSPSPSGNWDRKYIWGGPVIDSSGVKYKMWYGSGNVVGFGSIGYADSEIVNAINNTNANRMSIFPNPTNDLITINPDLIGTYLVEISSINGQSLYSSKMEGDSHQIDLTSFKKGVYFLTIRSKHIMTTRKIIKL